MNHIIWCVHRKTEVVSEFSEMIFLPQTIAKATELFLYLPDLYHSYIYLLIGVTWLFQYVLILFCCWYCAFFNSFLYFSYRRWFHRLCGQNFCFSWFSTLPILCASLLLYCRNLICTSPVLFFGWSCCPEVLEVFLGNVSFSCFV